MENQYGIVVSNKYALFLNENDDPLDIIRQQTEAKVKKKDTVKKEVDKTKTSKVKPLKKSVAPIQQESKSKTPEQSTQRRDVAENPRREGPPRGQSRGRGRGSFRSAREPENRDSNEFGENETDRRPPRRRDDFSSEYRERSDGFGRSGGFGRSEGGFGKSEGGSGSNFGGRSENLGFNRNSEEGSFGRSEGFRGRGPRRGGRGGRGRGGPGGQVFGDRGGKREFERHSGSDKTGVKAVDKREGGGSHNWGTVKDDMEEQMKEAENPDWSTQVEDAENQDPNESAVETSEANPEVPEEEAIVKQMTLDEWKAMEGKNRFKSQFNIRKPNEGVDDTQWKQTYVLKKPRESENEEEEDEEEEDEGYEDEPRRSKNILHNIKITFNDSPRRGRGGGRRGRGGSGGDGRGGSNEGSGGRGEGRGRGGPRVNQRADKKGPRESAPCMDDENDFPRLVQTAA